MRVRNQTPNAAGRDNNFFMEKQETAFQKKTYLVKKKKKAGFCQIEKVGKAPFAMCPNKIIANI